jgi:hypothetical protein
MNARLLCGLVCWAAVFSEVGVAEAAAGSITAFQGQKLVIPSYFSPLSAPWARLERSAPAVGVTVINPASGPGQRFNQDYFKQTRRAQTRGILVIGYVHTSYGQRSPAEVQGEIDRYYNWYGVDGIFVDEVSTDCQLQPYFQRVFDYIKAKGGVGRVVLNPGSIVPECYISAGDIIITFESTYDVYVDWRPSGWELAYPASRFCHIIHGTSAADLPNALALSKRRHAGWVYATPDTLPNPWDTLPEEPYWSDELAWASQ